MIIKFRRHIGSLSFLIFVSIILAFICNELFYRGHQFQNFGADYGKTSDFKTFLISKRKKAETNKLETNMQTSSTSFCQPCRKMKNKIILNNQSAAGLNDRIVIFSVEIKWGNADMSEAAQGRPSS